MKPGDDDVAGRVDDAHAGERRLGHGRDLPAPNPDVAHRVEPRLGIEDASVRDHQIVGRRRLARARRERETHRRDEQRRPADHAG